MAKKKPKTHNLYSTEVYTEGPDLGYSNLLQCRQNKCTRPACYILRKGGQLMKSSKNRICHRCFVINTQLAWTDVDNIYGVHKPLVSHGLSLRHICGLLHIKLIKVPRGGKDGKSSYRLVLDTHAELRGTYTFNTIKGMHEWLRDIGLTTEGHS